MLESSHRLLNEGDFKMNYIGSTLPDFKVNAFQNGEVQSLTAADLKGHWSVLFFYPADFSFVCPTELGDLAEHYAAFKDQDAEIYSVSEDTEFVHQAWHEQSPEEVAWQYISEWLWKCHNR